jgi:hypothetical protein
MLIPPNGAIVLSYVEQELKYDSHTPVLVEMHLSALLLLFMKHRLVI